MLHKGGIPVLVPDPARFAVHKLIVAARRERGSGKDLKDLQQADALAEALGTAGRADDLTQAFTEARGRGPAWREAIDSSLERMRSVGLTTMPSAVAI